MKKTTTLPIMASIALLSLPDVAFAQTDAASLQGLSNQALKPELDRRYEAGLNATLDPAILNANDNRFLWANEAKIQCAIALGFLKSSTQDEPSIRKCALAYDRLMQVAVAPPPPVAPAPPPPPRPTICSESLAGMVFFDFDSDVPSAEAVQILSGVANNFRICGWRGLSVVGHADKSGSDSYNQALSTRRANAVVSALVSERIPAGAMDAEARGESQPRVPTEDGVREPQNRRVEITVEQ